MVHTKHKFLYPHSITDRAAIIGTIHPHQISAFLIAYFYGNKASIWNILAEATGISLDNKEAIIKMLQQNNIWVTDMIAACDRDHEGVFADEALYNLQLNTNMIRAALENSRIDTIYLTSRFSKNNAAQLFVKAFGIDYKKTWNPMTSEFLIDAKHFGRPIRAIALYSPSGNANRGIANSKLYKSMKYGKEGYSVKQFKIEYYRDKFSFLVKK